MVVYCVTFKWGYNLNIVLDVMASWTQSCPETIKQTTSKTEIMGFIFIRRFIDMGTATDKHRSDRSTPQQTGLAGRPGRNECLPGMEALLKGSSTSDRIFISVGPNRWERAYFDFYLVLLNIKYRFTGSFMKQRRHYRKEASYQWRLNEDMTPLTRSAERL